MVPVACCRLLLPRSPHLPVGPMPVPGCCNTSVEVLVGAPAGHSRPMLGAIWCRRGGAGSWGRCQGYRGSAQCVRSNA
eukprot:5876860-Prorocentrum_lima.AAC.1